MEALRKYRHEKFAPYWAAAMIVFCAAGLSSNYMDVGDFWRGYALDMTGPAWNYILFRVLFTTYKENAWRRFFTPLRTFVIFLLVCFSIEGAQFLNLYKSTYDPYDFLAYISLLIPVFLIDYYLSRETERLINTR